MTNETGLSGRLDLFLKYVSDGADGPSVFGALKKQLGLKLEACRGPVEVFVIDSAARPRENQFAVLDLFAHSANLRTPSARLRSSAALNFRRDAISSLAAKAAPIDAFAAAS